MQDYNKNEAILNIEKQNKDKLNNLKQRIEKFKDIETLEEAKIILAENFRVENELEIFNIASSKCTIVNRNDFLRISLDTPDEFVSYDFRWFFINDLSTL